MRKRKPRPPLPPACLLCRLYQGTHRNYGTTDAPRLGRCDCARGDALAMGARWGKPAKKRPGTPNDGKAKGMADA